jgi:hypothetical protein
MGSERRMSKRAGDELLMQFLALNLDLFKVRKYIIGDSIRQRS